MKYLSLPAAQMKPNYDIVVIGSGYGGGIAASRLSRAGKKVCVLERGKERQAGEFPNNMISATAQMQVRTPLGHTGSDTGLYDLRVFPGISVLVGCGLGGTSLINANVSIKPEERVFDDECWPKELRDEFDDTSSTLHKAYARALHMLKANPLPDSIQLNKLNALQKAADTNNEKFYRTQINVNFDIDGENHVGVEQKPCNMCGDCCSGCNYEAKNTVMMNYLPDAKAHGAEIFTETQVSHLKRRGDKWLIYYSIASSGSDKFDAPELFVEADVVVLSAGTLGSNEIMLRSKQMGLPVSDQLGYRFSGNGDVIGFAYNTAHTIYGVGQASNKLEDEQKPGPCITGVIDLRYKEKLNEGMIIEDAVIPGVLGTVFPVMLDVQNKLIGSVQRQDTDSTLIQNLKHGLSSAESNIMGPYVGALKNTQTYLMMTHDSESGRLSLNKDRLDLDWRFVGNEEIFHMADEQLRKETKAISGVYVKNPIWVKEMGNELITVHPLGGCHMGDSIESGVVNHKGQVYSNESSTGVYENLYIADGSVVPRSLGVNPLLTISAIAERCCELIASDRNWTIDFDSTKKVQYTEASIRKPGIQFTETMKGYFSTEVTNDDYKSGFEKGKTSNSPFSFTLTIRSEDVYEMIKNPEHSALMSGTVLAPSLSSAPLNVSNGIFNLFVNDPDRPGTKLMKYSMRLNSVEGKSYFFKGFKLVHDDRGMDEWSDTSTLFITIYEGTDDKGKKLGQGILQIKLTDFVKQMQTIKAVNTHSTEDGIKAVFAFNKYFSECMLEVYGNIFSFKL